MEAMQELGFRRGLGSPCAFYNASRNARVVVHGDDFTILAEKGVIEWFVEGLRRRFELKLKGIIGPRKEDQKEMRVLNRVVTWDERGLRYEADQRHVEILVNQLGLGESKSLATPGDKNEVENLGEEGDEQLGEEQVRNYRACVARANYVTQDRTDIGFSVKELSRGMSNPTQGYLKKLKRLGRYLKG